MLLKWLPLPRCWRWEGADRYELLTNRWRGQTFHRNVEGVKSKSAKRHIWAWGLEKSNWYSYTKACLVFLQPFKVYLLLYVKNQSHYRPEVPRGFREINLLTPNDDYSGRTAPLTSKRCISYIYSTHIGTEYFKHVIYSPFFSLQNAVFFS